MGKRRRWVSTVIRGWKRGKNYLSTSQVYHKLWVWLLLWHAKFLAELRRKKFKSYLQPLWNTFLPIYAFQFRASGLECRVRAFSGWPKALSGLRASSLARTHHYGKGSLAREQEEEKMWSRICHREKVGKHGNRYLIGLACTRDIVRMQKQVSCCCSSVRKKGGGVFDLGPDLAWCFCWVNSLNRRVLFSQKRKRRKEQILSPPPLLVFQGVYFSIFRFILHILCMLKIRIKKVKMEKSTKSYCKVSRSRKITDCL